MTVLKQVLNTTRHLICLTFLVNSFSAFSDDYFVYSSPQISPSFSIYPILSANSHTMDLIEKLDYSRWKLSHLFTISTGNSFNERSALTNILANKLHLTSVFYLLDVLSRTSFLESLPSLLNQFLPLHWIPTYQIPKSTSPASVHSTLTT